MFSKPVIATLDRRHYSHYPQFMDPLGIPFETQICNMLHFIFRMIFSSQVYFQSEISLRHLRHKGGKGGTGRHLGGIWEAAGRQLGGIWEASGRHQGGIWKASGTHLRGIWKSRRSWGSRSLRMSKIDAPLSKNAKVELKCLFYIVILKVRSRSMRNSSI